MKEPMLMPTIPIDDDVYAVVTRGLSYGITANTALRALLGLSPPDLAPPAPPTAPARTSYTGPHRTDHGKLAALVTAGLLREGQIVTWQRRNLGDTFAATVTAEGHLLTSDGVLHLSPDRCATHLAGYPVHGWTRWRTADGNNLHDLRNRLGSEPPRPDDHGPAHATRDMTSSGKLAALVTAGLLHEGQTVTWQRRNLGDTYAATVTAEGHLLTPDGVRHLSPGSCATYLAGYPIGGWTLWRTADGSSLHALRSRLPAPHQRGGPGRTAAKAEPAARPAHQSAQGDR